MSRLRTVRVCGWCEDRHLRPYPEDPDAVCEVTDCQCWCRL